MMTTEQILGQAGKDTVKDLQEAFRRSGVNASGKLSDTLEYKVQKSGLVFRLTVEAEGYIFTVETGRKPSKRSEGGILRERIRQWIDDKGIFGSLDIREKDGLSYAITKNIHKYGTKRWRALGSKGQGSGILSGVLNDERIETIEQQLLNNFADAFLEGVARATKE